MSKKIKIVSIVPDNYLKPKGGLGVQFQILHKYLKEDFDFQVFGYPEQNNLDFFHGVSAELPPMIHGGLSNLLLQQEYVAQILKYANDADIIHATDYSVYYAGIYASKILNKPLILTSQISPRFMANVGEFNAFDSKSPDGQAIIRSYFNIEILAFQKASAIIHNSLQYKTFFDQENWHKQKSIYIPNGADHVIFKKTKDIILPGKNKLKVLYVGRLSTEKNILKLLTSVIPNNVDLILMTDINSAPESIQNLLSQKIKTNSNIHYLGPKYDQEKIDCFFASDAIILPSKQECHPLILHEALITNNIFISSFVGDIRSVFDETVGINCGTEIDTISKALFDLSIMSEQEIERRKKIGFEIEKNYDFKDLAIKYKEVYLSIIK